MEKMVVDQLNEFLKGINMAAESYEKCIYNANDQATKSTLEAIQKDHRAHALIVTDRIHDLGGYAKGSTGIAGKMAEWMTEIKDMGSTKIDDCLKEVYDGENKGIAMTEQLVRGDLDKTSMDMVRDILNDDRKHLNTLSQMLK